MARGVDGRYGRLFWRAKGCCFDRDGRKRGRRNLFLCGASSYQCAADVVGEVEVVAGVCGERRTPGDFQHSDSHVSL